MPKDEMIIEDPKSHIGKLCHVEGGKLGTVWRLQQSDGVRHTLVTPATGRIRFTCRNLTYTNSQKQKLKNSR